MCWFYVSFVLRTPFRWWFNRQNTRVQGYVLILTSDICIYWYKWMIREAMHGLNNNNNNNTLPTQFTPPHVCFVLDYPLINQTLHFLPLTLPMWLFYFSLSHRLQFLLSRGVSLQSYIDYNTPLQPTTRNNPISCHHTTENFTSHDFPCINSVLGLRGFIRILESWGWDR